MIVLHAALVEGKFFLWGEKSLNADASVTKRRSRKTAKSPAALPFEAGVEALTDALKNLVPSGSVEKMTASSLVAWLPTTDQKPVASTLLIAEPPEPGASLALAAWTVSAIRLDPPTMVELLGACLDKDTLGPGLVAGQRFE
jgi:hypothetical protein